MLDIAVDQRDHRQSAIEDALNDGQSVGHGDQHVQLQRHDLFDLGRGVVGVGELDV